MNNENKIIVYINPHSDLPIWIYGDKHITDMDMLAKLYVPEGVTYNIIDKEDMHQPAGPHIIEEPIEEKDLTSLFYTYLDAL